MGEKPEQGKKPANETAKRAFLLAREAATPIVFSHRSPPQCQNLSHPRKNHS
jgi:hypothetical protein